jgi:hypothetical protein
VPAGVASAVARGALAAQFAIQVRADGFFSLPAAATAGEYQIVPMMMPLGYYMKSAAVDPVTSHLQITLTTTRPATEPRGVKVSGRVSGLPPLAGQATRWVSVQMNTPGAVGQMEQRIGETLIRADGTFEFPNVPRGVANLNVVSPPGTNPPTSLTMRLDLADQDVFVEFSVASSEPAGGPLAPAGGIQPAPPITVILPDSFGASPPPAPPPIVIPAPPPPPPNFSPPPIVQVSGTVIFRNARAPGTPTFLIALTQNGVTRTIVAIGADGAFRFFGVTPGTYKVQLSLGSVYVLPEDFVIGDRDVSGLVINAPGP